MNREQLEMQELAKAWLSEGCLILDTETTGLDSSAEIVEISIIDHNGAIVLDTLIKPTKPIPADASKIHGITDDMVANAPSFADIADEFFAIIAHKTMVIYNANYDIRIIEQTAKMHGIEQANYTKWDSDAQCAMLAYAQYYGQWDDYRDQYKWQRLGNAAKQQGVIVEGKAHRALADVKMTLGIIQSMAQEEI